MNAIDLVQLPRMTAVGTLAFGEQLISAAAPNKKALPKTCVKSLGALTAARSVLAGALRDRVDPFAASEDVVALDRAVGSGWSGLCDYTAAFTKLPQGGPLAEHARVIHVGLFADGLKFTMLAYPLEWAESQVRLERMETPEMAAALHAIGAGTFVDAIRTAHVAYGKALGMGAAKTVSAPPAVRPAYLAMTEAIRLYVVKVIASIEPELPATQALADALLVPLTTWSVRSGKRNGAEPEGDGDDAAPETVPVAKVPA